jgi:hypothetical protein
MRPSLSAQNATEVFRPARIASQRVRFRTPEEAPYVRGLSIKSATVDRRYFARVGRTEPDRRVGCLQCRRRLRAAEQFPRRDRLSGTAGYREETTSPSDLGTLSRRLGSELRSKQTAADVPLHAARGTAVGKTLATRASVLC